MTLQGALVVLTSFVLQNAGIDLDEGIVTELVYGIFDLVGIVMVVIGRMRATERIITR